MNELHTPRFLLSIHTTYKIKHAHKVAKASMCSLSLTKQRLHYFLKPHCLTWKCKWCHLIQLTHLATIVLYPSSQTLSSSLYTIILRYRTWENSQECIRKGCLSPTVQPTSFQCSGSVAMTALSVLNPVCRYRHWAATSPRSHTAQTSHAPVGACAWQHPTQGKGRWTCKTRGKQRRGWSFPRLQWKEDHSAT